MSPREPLDEMLGVVREEVRARADGGGRVRDFAAMIARARALAPDAVSEAAAEEASRFAPVVTLRAASSVAAVEPPTPRRRTPTWLAAAAALLVAAGLVGMVRLVRRAEPSQAAQAMPLMGAPAVDGEAIAPAPVAPPRRAAAEDGPGDRSAATGEDDPEDMSGATGEVVLEDRSGAGVEGVPEDRSVASEAPAERAVPQDRGGGAAVREDRPKRGAPPAAAKAPEDPWEALDEAAHAAWRRGDVAETRSLLTALARSSAGAARRELAYGDLFVLARRSDDPEALARLWREYLERFPRGLYAEGARAGLCRRAEGAARAACWALYLETWPEGSHADEAREAM